MARLPLYAHLLHLQLTVAYECSSRPPSRSSLSSPLAGCVFCCHRKIMQNSSKVSISSPAYKTTSSSRERQRERESVCLGEEKKNRKENKTGMKGWWNERGAVRKMLGIKKMQSSKLWSRINKRNLWKVMKNFCFTRQYVICNVSVCMCVCGLKPPRAFWKSAICRQNLTYSFFPLAALVKYDEHFIAKDTCQIFWHIQEFGGLSKWLILPNYPPRIQYEYQD